MIKKITMGLTGIFILVLITLVLTYFYQKDLVELNAKGEIFYNGGITLDKVNQVVNLYEKSAKKPNSITIRSQGGSISAGIKLGYFIHKNNLAVEVRDYCISSCANYVFLAGRERLLNKNSLVIYHGGRRQKNIKENIIQSLNGNNKFKQSYEITWGDLLERDESENRKSEQGKYTPGQPCEYLKNNQNMEEKYIKLVVYTCVNAAIQEEDEFYETLGVSNEIPMYGQKGKYEKIYKLYEYIGFYYSLESLRKLGVAVKVKGGIWSPHGNRKFNNIYEVIF